MVNAAFVAPYLLEATTRFVDAAARLPGVRLALITQTPADHVPAHLRQSCAAHWRVDDALDPDQIVAAVHGLGEQMGRVERLLGALEQLQVPLGVAREKLGITGMDSQTAANFRDKSRMKDVLRAHGVPVARHRLVGRPDQAVAFAEEIGFPIVVKPPAGAGALSTFRLDDAGALYRWIEASPPSEANPTLMEEFLLGEEFTFDSIMLNGHVVWHSIARYYPTPLEVLHNPWMQWVVLLPRDISGPEFDGIREVGPAALRALGLHTGLSHMEWFRRPDGSVAISEVGARPPGAQITTSMSYAHDIDMYSAWPRLMIHDAFEPPERRYAVGVVYVRGQGAGRVRAVHGLDDLQREIGHLVVETRLPQPGQAPTGTYEGEGYVIVRDQDTSVVTDALGKLLGRLRVEMAP